MSNTKIAVIGAGLAGLTVAYRLSQKGYDVTVYEARSRVGGRVHTILIKNEEDGYSIGELGGQNITDGGEAIYIRQLAKELSLDILEDNIDFNVAYYDGHHFYERQKTLLQFLTQHEGLLDKLEMLSHTCRSMQEVLNQLLPSSLLKNMLSFSLNAYEGLPPRLLSAQPHNINTLKYMLLGGLSHVHQTDLIHPIIRRATLKEGNAALPLKLAKFLDNHIQLEKALIQAVQQQGNIALTFADGSFSFCTHLILAIPCPCFAQIYFDPNILDEKRLQSIQALLYGTNAKILLPVQYANLSYNAIFTEKVGAFFNQDKKLLNVYFTRDTKTGEFWQKDFQQILDLLKKGFPTHVNESYPLTITATDNHFKKYATPVAKSWLSDPYSQGSYATYDVHLQEKIDLRSHYQGIEFKTLFSPIQDRIFFAGEHTTILDEIGTLEAAVESGERIAKLF